MRKQSPHRGQPPPDRTRGQVLSRSTGQPSAPSVGPLRLVVLSVRCESRARERRAIEAGLRATFDGYDGRRLALLPGVGHERPLVWLTELLRGLAANGLFEATAGGRSGFYAHCFTRDLLHGPIYQRFATSRDASRAIVGEVLMECAPGGIRTFPIGGLTAGVLICGENNILVNQQSLGNRCGGVRHFPETSLFEHVGLVHNGAHTLMGNWGKLNARFAWLSGGGRLATYATNNDGRRWGRALRLFYDGRRLADGDAAVSESGLHCAVRIDADRDRYRAIVADVAPDLLRGLPGSPIRPDAGPSE